jgi:hypothetical protein
MYPNPTLAVGFIDILFAFVIGFGLESVKEERWVSDFIHNWKDLSLWFFVLSNVVVIGSWVGYHRTTLPQDLDNLPHTLRFVIDVILVFLYFRLMRNIDGPHFDPHLMFAIMFQAFVWYGIGDVMALFDRQDRWRQELATAGGLSLSFFLWQYARKLLAEGNDSRWRKLILGEALVLILYRVLPGNPSALPH